VHAKGKKLDLWAHVAIGRQVYTWKMIRTVAEGEGSQDAIDYKNVGSVLRILCIRRCQVLKLYWSVKADADNQALDDELDTD
jgi:hypothetical protein